MNEPFITWAVYAQPSDHPKSFIARCWETRDGETVVSKRPIIECSTLEEMHETMETMGLVCLMPMPDDDPVIVETWI